jgi:hypothetical protein
MDFWTSPSVILIAVVFAVGLLVLRIRRSSPVDKLVIEERQRVERESAERCVCGEIATDPAPVLKRGRGAWDWLRNLYGAPPRYTREVDHMRRPTFCRAHVHVADAMLDQFVFGIRARYSELNADIAAKAAGFEQEHLQRQVADSLTEKQKRATRPSALRMLPTAQKTGTEDEAASER